jgi:NADPH:quinone reductase-like Zn-dependent oxidoreductase
MNNFTALVVREAEEGDPKSAAASIEQLTDDDLPTYDGDETVVVDVDYSSLNYKDGMALTGRGRIIRSFPMVPGVDLSGTVVSSESPRFEAGDGVILTGWAVGERYWGGYSQRQRVKSDWLVRRPDGLDSRQAMGIAFLGREEMSEAPRPLEGEQWAGAIDAVGSTMLARILAQTKYGGTVTACGLAGGHDLPTTVMPFILRGVRLQGIDSVMAPLAVRDAAWARLVADLPAGLLDAMIEVVPMSSLPEQADAIMAGKTRGRLVVDPSS